MVWCADRWSPCLSRCTRRDCKTVATDCVPNRPKAGRGMMRCFGGRPDRGGGRRPRACPPPARGRPGFAPGRQSRPFQAPAPKAVRNRSVRQAAPSWSRAPCMPRRSSLAKACGRCAPPQAGRRSETYAHRAREPAEASGRGKASGQGEGVGPGGRHRAEGGSGHRPERRQKTGPHWPALPCLGLPWSAAIGRRHPPIQTATTPPQGRGSKRTTRREPGAGA